MVQAVEASLAAYLLGKRTVIGSSATVLTNLLLVLSVLFAAGGVYLAVDNSVTTNLRDIGMFDECEECYNRNFNQCAGIVATCVGGASVLIASLGLIALNRKVGSLLCIYAVLMIIATAGAIFLVYFILQEVRSCAAQAHDSSHHSVGG